MPALILASQSPYRATLLRQCGYVFRTEAPDCDEDSFKAEISDPSELARRLAAAKAESVLTRHPDAIVIGSDQVCVFDGEVFSKPGTPERATQQLKKLSGQNHRLFTAVSVLSSVHSFAHLDCTELSMRTLDGTAIARYVERDMPLDCAGSYKIEGLGATLFTEIIGRDPNAVIGLPLFFVVDALAKLGVQAP